MKLVIFCAMGEKSLDLFEKAASDLSIATSSVLYKKLSILDGELYYEGERLEIKKDDKIIIRWPWEAEEIDRYDYNLFVNYILSRYGDQVALDKKVLNDFTPYYEDKLFQSFYFDELGITTPKTYYFVTEDEALKRLKFPVVAKKRVASRWRQNFVLNDADHLKKKFCDRKIDKYIFQEIIEDFKDVRVYTYHGKVIASSLRETIREGEQIRVKVKGDYNLNDAEIVRNVEKISAYLGADLLGFDVLITDTKNYFIEANLSPQFAAIYGITGLNIAEIVMKDLFG